MPTRYLGLSIYHYRIDGLLMNVLIGILLYPPDFTGAGLRIHMLYSNLKRKGIKKIYVITNCLEKIDAKTRIYEDMEIIMSILISNMRKNKKVS